jgi:hypothetical protein
MSVCVCSVPTRFILINVKPEGKCGLREVLSSATLQIASKQGSENRHINGHTYRHGVRHNLNTIRD